MAYSQVNVRCYFYFNKVHKLNTYTYICVYMNIYHILAFTLTYKERYLYFTVTSSVPYTLNLLRRCCAKTNLTQNTKF